MSLAFSDLKFALPIACRTLLREDLLAIAGDAASGELWWPDVEVADFAAAVCDDDVFVIPFRIDTPVAHHGDGNCAVDILAHLIGGVFLEKRVRGEFVAIKLHASLCEFLADIFERVAGVVSRTRKWLSFALHRPIESTTAYRRRSNQTQDRLVNPQPEGEK